MNALQALIEDARKARGWSREQLKRAANNGGCEPPVTTGYIQWLEVARQTIKLDDPRFLAVCRTLGLDLETVARKAVGL